MAYFHSTDKHLDFTLTEQFRNLILTVLKHHPVSDEDLKAHNMTRGEFEGDLRELGLSTGDHIGYFSGVGRCKSCGM